MGNKKEKLFWGIKESEIDENLLKKILKCQKIILIATAIFLPFVVLNLLLQLLHKYINNTVHLVLSGIFIAVFLSVIVLDLIYIINISKLKKQVKQAQSQAEDEKEK